MRKSWSFSVSRTLDEAVSSALFSSAGQGPGATSWGDWLPRQRARSLTKGPTPTDPTLAHAGRITSSIQRRQRQRPLSNIATNFDRYMKFWPSIEPIYSIHSSFILLLPPFFAFFARIEDQHCLSSKTIATCFFRGQPSPKAS